jgi:hypothetical protein
VLPQIAEIVLIQEAFIDAKVQVPKLNFPGIVATTQPATAWHSVILLPDAKAMEMEIRPIKADLQDDMKIGQSAVGSHEKAPPEHWVDLPNPDVDKVNFELRIVFHTRLSLSGEQRLGSS